jgi:glycolate oxidase
LIANIAHIGDGNLHPLLIAEPGDTAAQDRAKIAFEEILSAALDLGGTVTGEHGVGLLKRGGLSRELSPAVLEMHRAVKAALDPTSHPQSRQGLLTAKYMSCDLGFLELSPRV